MDTEPETSFKKRFLWVVLSRNKSNIWRIAMAIQNQERKKERKKEFHNFTISQFHLWDFSQRSIKIESNF